MTIKIYELMADEGWCIWAEPDTDAVHEGLCIAFGGTREAALERGFRNIQDAFEQLVAAKLLKEKTKT